jgi:predicted Zn-ribbon and HTH transcriptional regulator
MSDELSSTLRQRMLELLLEETLTVRDLSKALGASEREVVRNLPNVARSAAHNHRFLIIPARCLNCGFEFKKRDRVTTPGKCPLCRSPRISPPAFHVS